MRHISPFSSLTLDLVRCELALGLYTNRHMCTNKNAHLGTHAHTHTQREQGNEEKHTIYEFAKNKIEFM